jgi:hypothetical protein
LEVPSFVEDNMMTLLDSTRVDIHTRNIFIGGSVSEEYSREVMSVQLGPALPSAFDTYPRPKNLELAEVRFDAMPRFIWRHHNGSVDSSVV